MKTINNAELVNEARKAVALNANIDIPPSQVGDAVQFVCEVNPRLTRYANIARSGYTNAGNSTIYLTPIDRDFFLTFAAISQDKAIGESQTNASLSVNTEDGRTCQIVGVPGITLTAEHDKMTATFNPPLKLQRNSQVTITKVAANGNVYGSIVGFEVI